MDIDPDIANWVLEFLLRQPLQDGTLKSLLRLLPLRDGDPHLKKLILLKKLEYDASGDAVSEETLESLGQLADMEAQNVSDAMRRAYCAVAVECTVTGLANQDIGDAMSKFRYFETVKRVWKGQIGKMRKGGLWSEELWAWKEEIEASVWDDNVYEEVVKKSLGVNAVEAVEDYLREEREKCGPSFLEVVAARVKDDEYVRELMLGVEGVDKVAEKEKHSDGFGLVEDDTNVSQETPKGKVHLRNKVVGLRHSRGSEFGNSRRGKIVEPNEMMAGPSRRNYNLPPTAEVHRVREALESSSLELQAVVMDPLPEALRLARAISNEAREHQHHHPVEKDCAKENADNSTGVHQPIGCRMSRDNGNHNPVREDAVETDAVFGDGVDRAVRRNASNVPRPSLMQRNATAHTYEWDDSIDRSQDDTTDHQERLLLPSPVVINVSPLKIYNSNNFKRRRRPKKWSPVEEDALRAGVQKFGKGNWKLILAAYRDKFEDRTEGDLKDKWRNLTRY